jgi:glycosyltransferase involved in cell wall biosynthesis
MASPLQPAILVAHPWMGRGGSEATAMGALDALQDLAKVTFTTASPVDWDSLNAAYGTRVSPEKITFQPAPRLPGVHSGTTVAFWQRAFFERFCRKLGARYDACISAYNPLRFGRPALQLIGDFSFDEASRLQLYPQATEQARHRPSLARQCYLSVGEKIAGHPHDGIAGPGDRIVANSRWSAAVLRRRFQLPELPVLYPPVHAAIPAARLPRDPLAFVCLGRIAPDKELPALIGILDRVRAAGHPVTLDLLGRFGSSAHAREIRRLADARQGWIRTPGFLGPAEKAAVFATRGFGIHACRVEAFGIAVAEMTAAGLPTFVPHEGGSGEIVADERLIYQNPDDAVRKILARLADPAGTEALRPLPREQAARFGPARFARDLVALVEDFLGRPLAPP